MKEKIKTMTLVAILTALAIVLSTWVKVPLISDIKLDLSYIVLTVAVLRTGLLGGIFVGGVSAFLGSLLFSAYGLSPSWILANIVTAIILWAFVKLAKGKTWVIAIGVVVAAAVGMLGVKTFVECTLYDIPLLVKIPKNAVAFAADAAVMELGLFVNKFIKVK